MTIEKYRHPFVFYGLATAIPWAFWFAAAWVSHLTPAGPMLALAAGLLGILGLLAPTLIALRMIWPDRSMRADLMGRLVGLQGVKPFYLFLTCFLMLGSILLAQAVSVAFGYSADQFTLRGESSFSAGLFPGWFLLILAPLVEELAWHSYGTDCLRQRMNLLKASLLFALFWGLWHLPLGFIKDYYHANVAESGALYSLNFLVSLFPFVILMNWLYYKSNRSVLVAIVFHITAGVFNEMFATHPDSKVIQTGLLLVLAAVVVVKERDFFFDREYEEPASPPPAPAPA
ncbi:MAG TPA: CPBP family intramembrane glutamic endopeptidase [Geothrix sp.]|nr:CPBP family intramembrane glutamic endopeptidase [Geothrix sp.]